MCGELNLISQSKYITQNSFSTNTWYYIYDGSQIKKGATIKKNPIKIYVNGESMNLSPFKSNQTVWPRAKVIYSRETLESGTINSLKFTTVH